MCESFVFPPSQHRPNFNSSYPKLSGAIRYLGSSHCAIDMNPSFRLLVPHKKQQQLTEIRHFSNYGKQYAAHRPQHQIHQSIVRLSRDRQRPTRIPPPNLTKWKAHIRMRWFVFFKKVVNGTSISLNAFHAEQLRTFISYPKICSKKFSRSSLC